MEMPLDMTNVDADVDLIFAATQGDSKTVRRLLISGSGVTSVAKNAAFLRASAYGHNAVFLALVNDTDITQTAMNDAILQASENRHAEIVRALYIDPRVGSKGIGYALNRIEPIYNRLKASGNIVGMESYHEVLGILGQTTSTPLPPEIWKSVMGLLELPDLNAFSRSHSMFRNMFAEFQEPEEDSFYNAVRAGQYHAVQHLLSVQKFNIDPSEKGNRALIAAAALGHYNLVVLLLHDPRVHPSAPGGRALIAAAGNGHLSVVKRLIEDPRVNPSASDNRAIIAAATDGHSDVVKLLLEDPRVDPAASDNRAIVIAASRGHYDVVELLSVAPRVETLDAIIAATDEGHLHIVQLLIQNPWIGWVPMILNRLFIRAIWRGHTDITQFLISHAVTHGLSRELQYTGGFYEAIMAGQIDIVWLFLRQEFHDLTAVLRPIPFMHAIGFQRVEILEMLLAEGPRLFSPLIAEDRRAELRIFIPSILQKRNESLLDVFLKSPYVTPNVQDFLDALNVSSETMRLDELILQKIGPGMPIEALTLDPEFIRRVNRFVMTGILSLDPYDFNTVKGQRLLKLFTIRPSSDLIDYLLLAKDVTPSPSLISWAITNNATFDVVLALVQSGKFDLSWNNNEALMIAIEKGRADAVSAILYDERVDLSLGDNNAAILAMKSNFKEVFEIILADPRFIMRENLVITAVTNRYPLLETLLGHDKAVPFLYLAMEVALRSYDQRGSEVVEMAFQNPLNRLTKTDIEELKLLVFENPDAQIALEKYSQFR